MKFFGKSEDPEDLIYRGVSFLGRKQPKAAIALFNQALKADPKNTTALYNKGKALNQIRKYQDAITCFDKVLEITPNDAPSLNNRAIALAELGNPEDAMKFYDKAIEADPKYAAAYYNKGVISRTLSKQVIAS